MTCGPGLGGQEGHGQHRGKGARKEEYSVQCGRVGLMVLSPASWLPLLVSPNGQSFSGPWSLAGNSIHVSVVLIGYVQFVAALWSSAIVDWVFSSCLLSLFNWVRTVCQWIILSAFLYSLRLLCSRCPYKYYLVSVSLVENWLNLLEIFWLWLNRLFYNQHCGSDNCLIEIALLSFLL